LEHDAWRHTHRCFQLPDSHDSFPSSLSPSCWRWRPNAVSRTLRFALRSEAQGRRQANRLTTDRRPSISGLQLLKQLSNRMLPRIH
jgi:hypothetical protein